MRYGSICSGVEAATLAWEPLGWDCGWVSEIEPFPNAVLNHHWPDTPNLGDMTDDDFIERAAASGPIQCLVAGTPCQSFSVAGLRGGLDDDRGNLVLRFCQTALHLHPPWIVWENVPGVLSSNGGRDFGAILGALVECGYGFAYRVLDAHYFGVPQRRRRVILVGYLGDWRPPAAVLFERESLQRDITPRRETREEVASAVTASTGHHGHSSPRGDGTDNLVPEIAMIVNAREDPIRRLTPVECERLQGMPDHHTRIPWRNKPAEDCPDGPRYKAIGNSMAVPVMRWIGERIAMVQEAVDGI